MVTDSYTFKVQATPEPPERVVMVLDPSEADIIKALRGVTHHSIFLVRVGGDHRVKRMLMLPAKGMLHFFEAIEQVLA